MNDFDAADGGEDGAGVEDNAEDASGRGGDVGGDGDRGGGDGGLLLLLDGRESAEAVGVDEAEVRQLLQLLGCQARSCNSWVSGSSELT